MLARLPAHATLLLASFLLVYGTAVKSGRADFRALRIASLGRLGSRATFWIPCDVTTRWVGTRNRSPAGLRVLAAASRSLPTCKQAKCLCLESGGIQAGAGLSYSVVMTSISPVFPCFIFFFFKCLCLKNGSFEGRIRVTIVAWAVSGACSYVPERPTLCQTKRPYLS